MMTLDELEAELGWAVDDSVAEYFDGEHGDPDNWTVDAALEKDLMHWFRDALYRVDEPKIQEVSKLYSKAFRAAWKARS
jgi:hypothetical protein